MRDRRSQSGQHRLAQSCVISATRVYVIHYGHFLEQYRFEVPSLRFSTSVGKFFGHPSILSLDVHLDVASGIAIN